ncbi:MAG: hypothetical protein LZF86_110533 [Nitrospira sp.]|nr:MAG: hypothetical protein LZF86_110533 [Nitrospira sp.]
MNQFVVIHLEHQRYLGSGYWFTPILSIFRLRSAPCLRSRRCNNRGHSLIVAGWALVAVLLAPLHGLDFYDRDHRLRHGQFAQCPQGL